jgi:hypothetical protein
MEQQVLAKFIDFHQANFLTECTYLGSLGIVSNPILVTTKGTMVSACC